MAAVLEARSQQREQGDLELSAVRHQQALRAELAKLVEGWAVDELCSSVVLVCATAGSGSLLLQRVGSVLWMPSCIWRAQLQCSD